MNRRVVIFGGNGNLGTDLVKEFTRAGDSVISATRKDCDVTSVEGVRKFLAGHPADIVINATAYNAVDLAETEPARSVAMKLNGEAPGILAREAKKIGAKFLHFSSDYVFSGDATSTSDEDTFPSPVNVYGESKLAGEVSVRAEDDLAYIVRTSRLFGQQGASPDCKPSFVTLIVQRALTKPAITLVDEEFACPTYTADLAVAVRTLFDESYPAGTYNLVNEDDGVTWNGFAEEIFSVLGISPTRSTVDGATFKRPARRALSTMMNNTRGPKLPSRRDALTRFLLGPLKGGMKIEQTGIPGLFAFTPTRFGDERGWFSEVLSLVALRNLGLRTDLAQINEGQSTKGILRGLHFQAPPFAQAKIVSCTAGSIHDVAVDIRKNSPTFGKHFAIELSAANGKALYIPEGFAHGLLSLEDGSRIRYHVFGASWEKSSEGGLRYNDPALEIAWPDVGVPFSANARDASWPLFSELHTPFTEAL